MATPGLLLLIPVFHDLSDSFSWSFLYSTFCAIEHCEIVIGFYSLIGEGNPKAADHSYCGIGIGYCNKNPTE